MRQRVSSPWRSSRNTSDIAGHWLIHSDWIVLRLYGTLQVLNGSYCAETDPRSTPHANQQTLLQGALRSKVDGRSCRETEKPLRADEELKPWGGERILFTKLVIIDIIHRWRRRGRSAWPSPSQSGSWRPWSESRKVWPRWPCSLSSQMPMWKKHWESSRSSVVPFQSIKVSLHLHLVWSCNRVKPYIPSLGFNPVGCTFRGPWRCRGLHHWRRSGTYSQVVGLDYYSCSDSKNQSITRVLGLRSSWKSASQSEPRSRSTPSSRTLRSRSIPSARCRRCWPPWSGEGSCSTGCRGRCSTGSSRLEEKSNWKLSQRDFSVYTHLQFNIYFPLYTADMDIETKRAKTIILLKPSENIQFSSSTNMPSNIYWRWINWRQKALIHLRHGWLLNTVCTNPYHMAFAERWGLVWTKFRRNWLT